MKHIIFLASILVFVGAGCVNQRAVESPDAPPATSLEVPAPGFEDVEETIVVDEAPIEDARTDEAALPTVNAPVPPSEDASQEPSVASYTIVARQWAFEPSTIRVRKGQRVELTIQSVDVSHGFSLSAFNVSEQLEPGQTVRVNFIANTKGSFPFFCSVFCGQGHSLMRGTLIVE